MNRYGDYFLYTVLSSGWENVIVACIAPATYIVAVRYLTVPCYVVIRDKQRPLQNQTFITYFRAVVAN